MRTYNLPGSGYRIIELHALMDSSTTAGNHLAIDLHPNCHGVPETGSGGGLRDAVRPPGLSAGSRCGWNTGAGVCLCVGPGDVVLGCVGEDRGHCILFLLSQVVGQAAASGYSLPDHRRSHSS